MGQQYTLTFLFFLSSSGILIIYYLVYLVVSLCYFAERLDLGLRGGEEGLGLKQQHKH